MKREMYLEEIKNRILREGGDKVYISADFADIARIETVNRILSRLADEGIIRRVLQGIYECPKYSTFLKEYISPSADKIAQAIARKNGWEIIPNEDAALNMLGLSTQVPAVYIYACDGITKTYEVVGEFNKIKIIFKKTPIKDIKGMSFKTALIVQAQKAKGKQNIDDIFIRTVSDKLTPVEKTALLSETKNSTLWIRENMKKIATY
ncbi:hypothetical protein MmiEs2_01140 [Methanimicrococcus stummii]|uniref:Transcriptional regulator, AbiEi antitoxin, Type IV TA system n=1 Tax=Methanimicrococcus stummii TaxID=3028294 RepID=A0AA96ZWF5_9EURY|nr:DUF6088 family protein [Methanimicrococcus sp. Es2]WNY27935.1 hypothetical protein MmiEs2_01140 [Methanimicrococcus sp. Es2]